MSMSASLIAFIAPFTVLSSRPSSYRTTSGLTSPTFRAVRERVRAVFALKNEGVIVEFAAAHAEIAKSASVQFVDFFASSFLVQTVDILGYDGGEFARFFEFCEFYVRYVRFCVFDYQFFAVESVEFFRVGVKKTAGNDCFRRIFPLLAVKSVLTSEVRDAAFGAYACTSEKHDS